MNHNEELLIRQLMVQGYPRRKALAIVQRKASKMPARIAQRPIPTAQRTITCQPLLPAVFFPSDQVEPDIGNVSVQVLPETTCAESGITRGCFWTWKTFWYCFGAYLLYENRAAVGEVLRKIANAIPENWSYSPQPSFVQAQATPVLSPALSALVNPAPLALPDFTNTALPGLPQAKAQVTSQQPPAVLNNCQPALLPATPTVPCTPLANLSLDDILANIKQLQKPLLPPPPLFPAIPPEEARKKKILEQWRKITATPGVYLILGDQGTGKSVLGYFILELYSGRPVFVLALPQSAWKYLPKGFGVIRRIEDAPNGSTVLVDEAVLHYLSRESQAEANKQLMKLLTLARQKQLRLIFISQESRFIDISILSRSQALLVKEPALFQTRTERPEVAKIVEIAREEFDAAEGDMRRFTYVHSRTFRGMIENFCPSFYCDGLSNAFADVDVAQEPKDQSGTCSPEEMSREEKKAEAKRLYPLWKSLKKIADHLGVSKGTVWNFLNEDYEDTDDEPA